MTLDLAGMTPQSRDALNIIIEQLKTNDPSCTVSFLYVGEVPHTWFACQAVECKSLSAPKDTLPAEDACHGHPDLCRCKSNDLNNVPLQTPLPS